jgi:hypothetical protein
MSSMGVILYIDAQISRVDHIRIACILSEFVKVTKHIAELESEYRAKGSLICLV